VIDAEGLTMLRDWLIGLGIAACCLVLSWLVLLVLARRLPPGVLRDLVAFLASLK